MVSGPKESEKEYQYKRAKEVLDSAGWVFDAYVNEHTRRWLTSAPNDTAARDEAFMRARVATELKLEILHEVESYEADLKVREHKEKQSGKRE